MIKIAIINKSRTRVSLIEEKKDQRKFAFFKKSCSLKRNFWLKT
jgi:hypothetical protein